MDPVICIFPVTLASLPYLFIFVATLVLFISLLLSILIILLVFYHFNSFNHAYPAFL